MKLKEAFSYNNDPKPGFEYILTRVRFDYLNGPDADTKYHLNSAVHLTGVSSAGKDYEYVILTTPEPRLDAELYPGASTEGWAVYQVAVDDAKPLLAFDRDYKGKGGVWLKLYK